MGSRDSRPISRLVVAALAALVAAVAMTGPGAGSVRASGPVWRSVNPAGVDSYYFGVECDGSRAWVVGNDETILYTADSGEHWALHHVGPTSAYALYRVEFIDLNRGWAVGNGGVILYTSTGEAGGWSRQDSPRNAIFNDLSMLSPAGTITSIHGWIAGSSGTLLHTESADQPSGVMWSEIDTGVTNATDFNGVEFASHQIGWVVGDLYDPVSQDWSMVIRHTDDGGVSWVPQGPVPAAKGSLNAVDAVGADHAWTVGECWDAAALRYRAIGYRTMDGGLNWHPMNLGDRSRLTDVRFVDSHNGWIAGDEVLLHTTDGGITWTEEARPGGLPALNGLDVTAAGEGFAVGYVNTVLTRGIDGTPPLTTHDTDEQWRDTPVTVNLAATDDAAGVAAINYRINGGPLSTIPGAHTEVPFFAPPDHAGDGDHLLTYWAVDRAGNIEGVRSCRVRIDTRNPRARTPGRYTVRRYRYVNLKYRIVDAQPEVHADGSTSARSNQRAWKTASATLRLRTAAGKVVKTVKLGRRTTGTWYTCRLRVSWKPGRYRYQVQAADPAQNRSPWSTPGFVTCVRR